MTATLPIARTRDIPESTFVTTVARAAVGNPHAEIVETTVKALAFTPTTPTSGGLYRYSGEARAAGVRQPWSAILKVIKSPADFPPLLALPAAIRSQIVSQWAWEHEALVYQSGLLDHLPGDLRAPRCYGIQRVSDDRLWLWLEDLGEDPEPWTKSHYARAAHAIGRFNGSYMAERPPLATPASAFMQRYLEHAVRYVHVPVLTDPCAWTRPEVRAAFPESLVRRLLDVWNTRAALLGALDRLPRTLCHQDACRANLPQRRGPDGRLQVVAIDWAGYGEGAVGEDVGHLLASAVVYSRDVDPSDAEEFLEMIVDSYVAGLRTEGWRGEQRDARIGCAAAAVLRWAFSAPEVSVRPATWRNAEVVQGRPIGEIIDREARALRWLIDLADKVGR